MIRRRTPESNRTNFVVAVLCAWARQQHSWKTADTRTLEAQLAPVDVPFRLRRAEFVLQGINDLFGENGSDTRAELVAMKRACWDLLVELRAKQQSVASMVQGAFGKRKRGTMQPGNHLQLVWRARLAEHLGSFTCEPLMAHGGAGFVQSLIAADLIDEYNLLIHPVSLGAGLPLFPPTGKLRKLNLTDVKRFKNGAVAHTYKPV